MKNPCVIVHRLTNDELFRIIVIDKNFTESSNSPMAISRALARCLIAHVSTYSGTSKAQMNNGMRCSANDSNGFRFFGHGTFG